MIDPKTNLFIKKTFSSFLNKDAINGEVNYEKFSSGVNHVSTTILNLATKGAVMNAKNQDYSQRVK
ncbi:MAG: hypothetical protein HC811_13865 [Flammeovirgaceae bacterium]|nr:hypothetical protein [Flammeovirgaceae bacterium]